MAQFKMLVTMVVAILLSIATMLHWIPDNPSQLGWNIFLALISLAVLIFAAGPIFISACSRKLTMNTLVALGTGVAWSYSTVISIVAFFQPLPHAHFYYESVVVIIAFVHLGHFLTARAFAKTETAINQLMALQPKTAHIISENGEEQEIDINLVAVGSLLRIKPGERLPVDGSVLLGESHVDESMLSGESITVAKTPKSVVHAGTINQTGSLIIRATAVGTNTVLANIIRHTAIAKNSKPPLVEWVDKIAAFFVPCVLLLAVITFIIWHLITHEWSMAITTSISVLIIACPCVIGLATPLAIIVAIGRAAKCGILFQDAASLQKAANITHIFLDKTGTLTQGKPVISHFHSHQVNETDALQWSASLAQLSQHPLARALIQDAAENKLNLLPVNQFKEYFGLGMEGYLASGALIRVGQWSWLQTLNIAPEVTLLDQSTFYQAQGQTVIFISADDKLIALAAISDPPKSGARALVQQLKQDGICVAMLTGDHLNTAKVIADDLGIEEVHANLLPTEKLTIIHAARGQNSIIAMVGDGINDAPALAGADVGIALSTGADIAIASADVTILGQSLDRLPQLIILARATIRKIKQNLFLAFIYNIIALPLAAGILYPWTHWLLNPMIAAFLMAMSSVTVVVNTLI